MPKMILEYKKAVMSKIIETALEVFSTKGYQDLTMEEIAKKMGVSTGALYSYFTSKEEILKEIYKNGRQVVRKILSEASECENFKQTMELVFKLMSEEHEKHIRIYFEIFAIALHNEGIEKALKDDYEKDLASTQEFVQNLIAKKKVRADVDSRVLAQLFRALWMGASEKLVLGYEKAKVREDWLKSTSLIFSS